MRRHHSELPPSEIWPPPTQADLVGELASAAAPVGSEQRVPRSISPPTDKAVFAGLCMYVFPALLGTEGKRSRPMGSHSGYTVRGSPESRLC